ncbi:hypothetical protein ACFL1V_03855 [Pseudomonadota bacterium]
MNWIGAVVEVPHSAHRTSFPPGYGYDSRFHREWVEILRDNDQTAFAGAGQVDTRDDRSG